MKTSDKLLLILLLTIFGTFGAIHLTLYARLKNGHTSQSRRSETGWIKTYEGKAPAVVTLSGSVNVTISISDSFFVEMQSDAAKNIHSQMEGNDSLVVRTDNMFEVNPHNPFQNYSDLRWVSIHTVPHTRIRLNGVLALVQGGPHPGGPSLDIKTVNAQLWLGETYGRQGTLYPTEYYDSVHVTLENSNLVLHSNADIGKLSIQLDDQSEINDEHSKLGSLYFKYAPGSKIKLSGANLDKLTNTAH